MNIGDEVLYEGKVYTVKGYAATIDKKHRPYIELDWENYLAVAISELKYVDESKCTHGTIFIPEVAINLSTDEIRKRFPRHVGRCELGCGFLGIYYASFAHYTAGDW